MKNPFLAKTENKETIIEHTEKLLERMEALKHIYSNIKNLDWNILELACLYHDLGKMNTKFQNKLIRKLRRVKEYTDEFPEDLQDEFTNMEEIPHGYLSPAFLPKDELKKKFSDDELRILYQSIYFHHSRKKLENHNELKRIVNEDLNKYIQDFKFDRIKSIEKLNESFIRYIKRRIPDQYDTPETIRQYIMTKGLLNKIDYAASGGIPIEVKNENLFEKTNTYLSSGGFKPNELQEYMIENQDKNNVIIASTGIGKTEASLFWIGNNKGFFTLPLKVSINAIYDRVVDKIKFGKENTGLLHSETSSEYLKRNNNELDIEYYDQTKQLSLPLTICTLDQLVDFIFKYEGYELKLATLSYSKLIIDEIQMYSPELVAFLIVALKYITELGGKFSIVTATLPPIFLDFMKEQNIVFNQPLPFYKKIDGKVQLRHKLKVFEEDINTDHIKKNYKNKKVLIIVNTVKKAQEIYKKLKLDLDNETEIKLFHSRFIKKDRSKKENMILDMGKLEIKRTGIWITTQVVEASLDIDFDVLYTELSDIAGLLQRMGRVYRNRDLKEGLVNIYVYVGKDKFPSGIGSGDQSIIDKDIFELSKQAILTYVGDEMNGKEIDEKVKMELVKQVYSKERLVESNYYKKIKETIKHVMDIKAYEFMKKEVNLRNIENQIVIPKNIYEENKEFIQNNLHTIQETSDYNKKLIAKNEIKEFTMSIPKYQYDEAKRNGYIQGDFIELDKYNKIPIISYPYSFEKGLTRPQKKLDEFDEDLQFI
ncbi:CRISPR-associated helicase Cas3' [Crassaminicella thermophila]|uniref:CRISPR-associated helicase Cas3 n=1 Tax=Crassaminicella thermophila TaxID=2599308 RepID=A0A5C0SA60_CRATE|nr:CRISPR-associated helicase Cas3' [Crassaminicella thermophila]QEK11021.1 CRISPR-associated helicase Cas3' [Crassaminicella thermophila]